MILPVRMSANKSKQPGNEKQENANVKRKELLSTKITQKAWAIARESVDTSQKEQCQNRCSERFQTTRFFD